VKKCFKTSQNILKIKNFTRETKQFGNVVCSKYPLLKAMTLKIYSETLQIKKPEKYFSKRRVYEHYNCNCYVWYFKK